VADVSLRAEKKKRGFACAESVAWRLSGDLSYARGVNWVGRSSWETNIPTHWLTELERKSSLSGTSGRQNGTRTKMALPANLATHSVSK